MNYGLDDIYGEIDRQAKSYGVDPVLARALFAAENTSGGRFTTNEVSATKVNPNSKASGLFQVIPDTEAALQRQGRLAASADPLGLPYQVSRGLSAISEMQGRQKRPGDPFELAVMYNAGTKPWQSYLAGGAIPAETQQYLQKVKTSMADQGVTLTPQQIEQLAMRGPSGGASTPGTASSSSQRTSVSSNLYDPAAMAAYQQARGAADTAFINAQGAVQQAGDARQNLGMDYVASILAAGQGAAQVAQSQTELELASAERRKQILAQANLDPTVNNNRVDMALRDLDETSARIDAMRPEIDRKMALNFFDNPIEWIGAQLALPGEISTYNALARQQGDQIARYDIASKIADGQITRTQATEVDQIAKLGADKAKEIAGRSVAAANQAAIQVQAAAASSALQLAQMAQMQLGAAERGLALSREKQLVTEGMSESQKKDALEQMQMDKINTLLTAAGAKSRAPGELGPQLFDRASFKSLPKKAQEELISAAQSGTFGSTPAEANAFLNNWAGGLQGMATGGDAYAPRAFAGVLAAADVESTKIRDQWQALNPGKTANMAQIRDAAINQVAGNFLIAAETNLYRQPESNPYKIDYQKIFTDPKVMQNMANNSYVQTMQKLGPGGAESVGSTYDEQRAMTRLMADIGLSKNPQAAIKKAAADIASFYSVAMPYQQMNTKYNLFGMKTPLKGYPVMMQQVNEGKKIDMADRTMVENALTKQFVSDQRIKKFFVTPQDVFPFAFEAQNTNPNPNLP